MLLLPPCAATHHFVVVGCASRPRATRAAVLLMLGSFPNALLQAFRVAIYVGCYSCMQTLHQTVRISNSIAGEDDYRSLLFFYFIFLIFWLYIRLLMFLLLIFFCFLSIMLLETVEGRKLLERGSLNKRAFGPMPKFHRIWVARSQGG